MKRKRKSIKRYHRKATRSKHRRYSRGRRNPSKGRDSTHVEHFTAPEPVYCDFMYGLVKGTAIEVLEPGSGVYVGKGKIRVKFNRTQGAYRKGDVDTFTAATVVPRHYVRSQGRRYVISTNYYWDRS